MDKSRFFRKPRKELVQLNSQSYSLFAFCCSFVTHQSANQSIVARVCGIRFIPGKELVETTLGIVGQDIGQLDF